MLLLLSSLLAAGSIGELKALRFHLDPPSRGGLGALPLGMLAGQLSVVVLAAMFLSALTSSAC